MLAAIRSGALHGIEALVVDVEVDVSSGLPHTTTVGLPDGAVKEARSHPRRAPQRGLRVPATSPREPGTRRGAEGGRAFDLPIALGILAAEAAPLPRTWRPGACSASSVSTGECTVRGALPIAAASPGAPRARPHRPGENAAEAALAGGPPVVGAETLAEPVDTSAVGAR